MVGRGLKNMKLIAPPQQSEDLFAPEDDEGDAPAQEESSTEEEDNDSQECGQPLTTPPGPSRELSPSPHLNTQPTGEGSDDDQESITPSPTNGSQQTSNDKGKPSAKRKRVYSILSEEKEMIVAEWYREHELLYNKKLKAYRDREKKDRVHREIAAKINVTVKSLHKWLESMRTRFAKLIQLKSGQGAKELTEREMWIKEAFSFLRPHIVRCPSRKSKLYRAASQVTSPDVNSEVVDVVDEVLDDPDDPQEVSDVAPKQMPIKRAKALEDSLRTQAEKELMEKLREAEQHNALFAEEWKAAQRPENRHLQELKQFHQFMTTGIGNMDHRLIEHYMTEAMKLGQAMKAYSRGLGGLPRFTISEVCPPQQAPIHTPAPPQPTYESLNVAGPSGFNLATHSTSTPRSSWKSNTPNYGRPEATPVNLDSTHSSQRMGDLTSFERFMDSVSNNFL